MKRIVVTGIALLSLSSVAEAHRSPGPPPITAGATTCAEAARLPERDSTAAQ
jgi:hypothetical protein